MLKFSCHKGFRFSSAMTSEKCGVSDLFRIFHCTLNLFNIGGGRRGKNGWMTKQNRMRKSKDIMFIIPEKKGAGNDIFRVSLMALFNKVKLASSTKTGSRRQHLDNT